MNVQAVREINALTGVVEPATLKTMLTNCTGLYDPPDDLELTPVASDAIYSRLQMFKTVGEAMPDIIDTHMDAMNDAQVRKLLDILMVERNSNLYFMSRRLAEAILQA